MAGGGGGSGPRMAWGARLDGGVGDMGLGMGVAVDREREVGVWHHGENV